MDALECIYTRRSIRKYEDGDIPEGHIEKILDAGMSAPSAGNQQPWQFVVITDRAILDRFPEVHPYAGMIRNAAAAIVVCGDLEREKHKGFWVQDCSAAVQNILLAAHALGLGAVWTGVYPRDDRVVGVRKLLDLPDSIVPLALIPIGLPATESLKQDRYEKERVHFNGW